ncbi:MAG: hypothetical protein LH468_00280 [Nocardioides sp.]|nr:hypothetical protein [Nocardioides sp.]
MPSYLLLPSPLLTPASWAPTAAWLADTGHRVEVVGYPGDAPTPQAVLDTVLAAADGLRDLVLVPHSNAGLYAGHLADLVGARATVYVDAALPLVPGDDTALAAPELLAFLRGLADDDGRLPPWTQWWDDLEGLFPDAETRAAVEAGQPRVPLRYFTERVPVQEGWADRACGYLAFGPTYATEIVFARGHDWPVTTLDGGHLHQLHDPAEVGAAILGLVERL